MNERKGRGRYWLRGQGTHHQGGGELRVRQERRTLGPRRKAVQDGAAADLGLTCDQSNSGLMDYFVTFLIDLPISVVI